MCCACECDVKLYHAMIVDASIYRVEVKVWVLPIGAEVHSWVFYIHTIDTITHTVEVGVNAWGLWVCRSVWMMWLCWCLVGVGIYI